MTDKEIKYWAFLSYSHQDNREQHSGSPEVGSRCWAKWLYDALKTFSIPAEFVGQMNGRGEIIPERIDPIFRDEPERPEPADLSAAIRQALEQSICLIVICSPRSAQSLQVNEAVRYFKQLGRGNNILPIVVAGEPHASTGNQSGRSPADECFVPALLHPVLPDGTLDTTRPAGRSIFVDARHSVDKREILANDHRSAEADLEMAKIQLIALLLGVGFNGLWWREQKRHFFDLTEAQHQAREALVQVEETRLQLQTAQHQAREAQSQALESQNLPRDVHGQIQEAQNQAREAQNQAHETQNQLQECQNKVRDTQAQLEEARNRALTAENNVLEAQNQAREALKQLEEIRIQAREAQNKVLEIPNPPPTDPNQSQEVQNQVREARIEAHEAQNQLQECQNKIQDTQAQLEQARNRTLAAESKVLETQTQAREAQNLLEEARHQGQDAHNKFLAAQSQVQEFQNQARTAQSQLEEANHLARETQAKILEAQHQARAAQNQVLEIQNQTREVQGQIIAAQDQVRIIQNQSRNARRLAKVFALLAVLASLAASIALRQRMVAHQALARATAEAAGKFDLAPTGLDQETVRQVLQKIGGVESDANRRLDQLAARIPFAEIPKALQASADIVNDQQRSHFQKWLLVRLGWVNPLSAMACANTIDGKIVNDAGLDDSGSYFQLAVLDNWMQTDLPGAFNWVGQLPDAAARQHALEKIFPWVKSQPDSEAKNQALVIGIGELAKADVPQALTLVEALPEAGDWRSTAISSIAGQTDPSAALNWINQLESPPEIMQPRNEASPWTKFLLNSSFGGLLIFPVETEILSNTTNGPIAIPSKG